VALSKAEHYRRFLEQHTHVLGSREGLAAAAAVVVQKRRDQCHQCPEFAERSGSLRRRLQRIKDRCSTLEHRGLHIWTVLGKGSEVLASGLHKSLRNRVGVEERLKQALPGRKPEGYHLRGGGSAQGQLQKGEHQFVVFDKLQAALQTSGS
jgi:hypothetical protein